MVRKASSDFQMASSLRVPTFLPSFFHCHDWLCGPIRGRPGDVLSTGRGTPYSARAGRANSVTLVPRNILRPTKTARTSATDEGLRHRLHAGLDNSVDSIMAGDPSSLSILDDVTKLLQRNANSHQVALHGVLPALTGSMRWTFGG